MTGVRGMIGAGLALVQSGLKKVFDYGLNEAWSAFESSNRLEDVYDMLDVALEKLLVIKSHKERDVQTQRQKDTTSAYQLWTNRVSNIAEEADTLKRKYNQKRLSKYFDIRKRSSLSEKMAKSLAKIQQLRSDVPTDILVEKFPEAVSKIDVPKIAGYRTLYYCLQRIKCSLQNRKIRVIRVSGTKGVGKTTIVKNLYNDDEVTKLFEVVVFMKVGSAETYHKPQRAITEQLMVDRKAMKPPVEVAGRIRTELMNKKYLLILDEIDDFVILDELGILNNDNGSKVVITTQSDRSSNKVQVSIPVGQLSNDEAWKMFQEIAKPDKIPGAWPIARNICTKCSRLPFLINAIARSFKEKKSADSWRDGEKKLNLWPNPRNQGLEELYSFLMSCYEELEDENMKNCFLYTSLYPADSEIHIHYLVECWAAHGFLGEVNENRRYQDACDHGINILEQFVDVSLLEFGVGMRYVGMNYSIKQLASHISSGLETWQSTRWVSKISQNLSNLPSDLDCNNLLTLLLQKNPDLVGIPPKFFENMSNLVLLDLFGTKIGQLPSSVSKLPSLKGLYLNGCGLLMMLPSEITSLKQLEFLDIRDTGVPFMPTYLQDLPNLRCLRISHQRRAENVEACLNVISNLLKLEELAIEVNSYKHWCYDAKHVIQEVASLTNLSMLMCSFPSTIILRKFLERRFRQSSMQFISFQFFVGCKNSKWHQILESSQYKINKYLKYRRGNESKDLAIAEILPQTEALELVKHMDITSLSSWRNKSALTEIHDIVIKKCNQISTIVAGMDDNVVDGSILPKLQHLYLDNLLNLKLVFRGPLSPESLPNLQTLTLKNCPELERIFAGVAVGGFLQLQKLTVQDCKKIEELIIEIEPDQDVLPNLEVLVLSNLQNLRSICRDEMLTWGSLVSLEIRGCGQLKTLPFGADDARNLISIAGERGWWRSLRNEDKVRFQPKFIPLNN